MSSSIKEFNKDEVFQHWKNFLSRSNHYDVSIIISKINEGFCDHYQEIFVPHHPNHRTFMINSCSFYFYFDYIIEKVKEPALYGYEDENENLWSIRFVFQMYNLNYYEKDGNEYREVVDFLHEHCNPEFLAILEKINLEMDG